MKYLLVGVLVAGCGAGGESPAPESTTTSIGNPTTSIEVVPTTSLPEGMAGHLIDEIVTDASERTGVSQSEISVVSIEAQTFNDASLGCPEPGKMYAQMLTDGFVVLVDAGGVELDYRVAESGGSPVFCK